MVETARKQAVRKSPRLIEMSVRLDIARLVQSDPLGDGSELHASASVEFEDACDHPLKLKY